VAERSGRGNAPRPQAHGLWTLLNAVQQVAEAIDDTEMTAGSGAYQVALVFYKSVKMAVFESGEN
jgi:acyl dehydratase